MTYSVLIWNAFVVPGWSTSWMIAPNRSANSSRPFNQNYMLAKTITKHLDLHTSSWYYYVILWSGQQRVLVHGQFAGHQLHVFHCGKSSGETCIPSPLARGMHPELLEISEQKGSLDTNWLFAATANLVVTEQIMSLEQLMSNVSQRLVSGQMFCLKDCKIPTVQSLCVHKICIFK